MPRNAYAKFGRANKVFSGKCGSGELKDFKTIIFLQPHVSFTFFHLSVELYSRYSIILLYCMWLQYLKYLF